MRLLDGVVEARALKRGGGGGGHGRGWTAGAGGCDKGRRIEWTKLLKWDWLQGVEHP